MLGWSCYGPFDRMKPKYPQGFSFLHWVLKRDSIFQMKGMQYSISTEDMGVGRGAKLLAKKVVFSILRGKKQISPLVAPLEKLLGKSSTAPPPGKNSYNAYDRRHRLKKNIAMQNSYQN